MGDDAIFPPTNLFQLSQSMTKNGMASLRSVAKSIPGLHDVVKIAKLDRLPFAHPVGLSDDEVRDAIAATDNEEEVKDALYKLLDVVRKLCTPNDASVLVQRDRM